MQKHNGNELMNSWTMNINGAITKITKVYNNILSLLIHTIIE